jgi:hypothetical protein
MSVLMVWRAKLRDLKINLYFYMNIIDTLIWALPWDRRGIRGDPQRLTQAVNRQILRAKESLFPSVHVGDEDAFSGAGVVFGNLQAGVC